MPRKLILFFLPLLLLSAACGRKEVKYKNVFYWNLYTGITSMDPAFARSLANIMVATQLYNGLVQLDDSLGVQPCIAKSWKVSLDGKVYTFFIRKDVFFHDHPQFLNRKGRKVRAEDFVYSFSRIIDPVTASPGAWIFNDKVDSLKPFLAVNDTTLEIHLKKPFPPFLTLLTTSYCSVVPKEIVQFYGKDFREHPVGTGPFRMKFYYEDQKLVLEKNPNYFETAIGPDGKSQKLPYLEAVDISFITSKQNEFFSFIQGKLDYINGIDQSYKDNLLTKQGELKEKFKGKFRFDKTPFLNTEYFGFLTDSNLAKIKPEQYKKLRQAINYAIDRRKMMKFLRNNIGQPGEYGFVPPSLPPFSKEKKIYYSYNPTKARSLLAEAGFPEGKGLPVIHLATTSNYLDLSIYVQRTLQETGIRVSIDNVPPATLSEWKSKGQALFFRGSWIADYPDAENYLALFYSKNRPPAGPNYFHFSNAEYDRLYEAALTESNEQKRLKYYRQMQDIIMEEAPVLVLYYDEIVRLINNRIEGLTTNAINQVQLKKVRVKEIAESR